VKLGSEWADVLEDLISRRNIGHMTEFLTGYASWTKKKLT
jgi:hypothetical protein